ncbi:hypothetical protein ACHAXA_003367 [Cyclostephanos tholiformis]|uniref:BTB domain-containing protein n=1 Tax=Cyclostephanos tholiformis TaxID=382380 RepID=A0ABD3REC6_9STRA
MANNPGRQGGGGAAGGGGAGGGNAPNEHVEFTVKAEEDLYLTGSETTIRRVTADTNYSCLMLKTQRFSSLFRHYAKYHGLRKDDLEYYFVHPLENEDTPESVQLQRGDIIMVRKRRKVEAPEQAADDSEFFKDMRELLDDEEHMDAVFLVHRMPPKAKDAGGGTGTVGSKTTTTTTTARTTNGKRKKDVMTSSSTSESIHPSIKAAEFPFSDDDDADIASSSSSSSSSDVDIVEIRAHKCILTARADYFKALFRKNAGEVTPGGSSSSFREALGCVVRVDPTFTPKIVRLMLEFLYTNRIECLEKSSAKVLGPTTDELLSLLHLSDMWQLRDLKRLVEHELIRNHMKINTVARMYCATDDLHAKRLSKSCLEFIMDNYREVTGSVAFQEEMKHHPNLCIPVLKAAADLIPEPATKKQRTSGGSDLGGGGGKMEMPGSSNAAGIASSPVPDSDI